MRKMALVTIWIWPSCHTSFVFCNLQEVGAELKVPI